MSDYIKTDHPDFVIDPNTKTIINKNLNNLADYRKKINDSIRIEKLEKDMDSIKDMLSKILGKLN